MTTSRRRFLILGAGMLGASPVSVLAACGNGSGGVVGWTQGQSKPSGEVSQGQPGGVPPERAHVGLVPGVIVIEGIQFAGPDSSIRLHSFNTADMSMIGWFLRSKPHYWEIPRHTLKPEQKLDIKLGNGTDSEGLAFANGALGELKPEGGELALYSSNNFDSAFDMIHYVRWGNGVAGAEDVAVQAGIWKAGQSIEVTSIAGGGALLYDGQLPGQGAWSAKPGAL